MTGGALPYEHVHLPDGWGLGWAVQPDGALWPWLFDRRARDVTDQGCGCACCAPHDQLGPLPAAFARRLAARCGRPTKSGRPCRVEVYQLGDACPFHGGDP